MKPSLHGAALRVASALALPLVWAAERVLRARDPIAARRIFTSSAGRIAIHEATLSSGTPLVLFAEPRAIVDLGVLFAILEKERPVIAVDLPRVGFFGAGDLRVAVRELVADVERRFAAAPDVVAIGRAGEIVAPALATARPRAHSLAVIAFGMSKKSVRLCSGDASLGIPLAFLHADEESALVTAIDRVVFERPETRRFRVAGTRHRPHVEDGAATADVLRTFFRAVARPELRVIRGGRTGPTVRTAHPDIRPAARTARTVKRWT
jgi:hypothetical protein